MVQVLEETTRSGRVFECNIYENDNLKTANGTNPEFTVAVQLQATLDALGRNYRIAYDYAAVPLPDYDGVCQDQDSGTYGEWATYLETSGVDVAKDCNLLLTMNDLGGCGATGGNVAVFGAPHIDAAPGPMDFVVETDADWELGGNVYGALHEIGHNMGFVHSPHPGDAYVATDGIWHRTPTVGSTSETSNICGDTVDPRDDNPNATEAKDLYYTTCVGTEMQIVQGGSATITSLSVTPDVPVVGETVTIAATLTNTTSDPVSQSQPVLVGDTQIDTLEFSVPANDQQTLSTTWVPAATGDYLIQVDEGLTTVTVVSADATPIVVTDLRIREAAVVGEANAAIVVAENTGTTAASRAVDVTVDGTSIGSVTFDLGASESNTGTVPWTPDVARQYTLAAGGQSIVVTAEGGGPVDPGDPIPRLMTAAGGVGMLAFFLGRPEALA